MDKRTYQFAWDPNHDPNTCIKCRGFTWSQHFTIWGFALLLMSFFAAVENVPGLKDFLRENFNSKFWYTAAFSIALMVFSLALYYLRESRRMLYGVIEIICAFLFAVHSINKVNDVGYVELLSVVASIYVAVRGLDNYFVGKKALEHNPQTCEKCIARRNCKICQKEELDSLPAS